MVKIEIKSGSKLGPWALSTCMLAALALFAFGFSEDKSAIHRDALLEIKMLTKGPNKKFQEYCRSSLDENYNGVRKTFLQPIVDKINNLNSVIGDDRVQEFTPLFICPYPKLDGTLKDVLNYIMRSPTAYFMAPSAQFFREVEANSISSVSEFALPQIEDLTDKKGMEQAIKVISNAIRRNKITGFVRMGTVAFQSEKEKDFVGGLNCGNEHHHFFKK